MLDTPQIVETDEQLTAVIHLVVPRADIASAMGPAIEEVLTVLAAQGTVPAGPCFSWHRRLPTDSFDFEVGFPVARPVMPAGRVMASRLPAVKAVRTTYRGGYEGLGPAWGAFIGWIASEGLAVSDTLWECYVSGPATSPDPADWRTELNRVLKT